VRLVAKLMEELTTAVSCWRRRKKFVDERENFMVATSHVRWSANCLWWKW